MAEPLNINLGGISGVSMPFKGVDYEQPSQPITPTAVSIKKEGLFYDATVGETPVPTYQFSLEVDGVVVALFQKFGGMKIERAVEAFTEGGLNERTLELPGQVSYGHVTFESGLCKSNFFYNWMTAGQYIGYAYIKNFTLAQRRPSNKTNGYWEVAREWFFINAYPVAWEISDLSVDEEDSIAVEKLELTFDYFELYQAP